MTHRTNIIIFIFICTIFSCNTKKNKPIIVDFTNTIKLNSKNNYEPEKVLRVAVAAMVSPEETLSYYEDLFKYLSDKLNIKIEIVQKNSYQKVNEMLVSNKVDIAFICSGAYVYLNSKVDLLAVPVYQGKPYYRAYVIVNKDSHISSFSELRGHVFAYTDKLSNTGKLYPDKRVRDLNESPDSFFRKRLYTASHNLSIQMVAKGIVDGASVDGCIFNYLKLNKNKDVENVRIIEQSELFGIPPIVSAKNVSDDLKVRIKYILLNMDKEPEGKNIIDKLLIDKFTSANDSLYNSIREYCTGWNQ